jgi:hypothetical protein
MDRDSPLKERAITSLGFRYRNKKKGKLAVRTGGARGKLLM